MDKQQFDERYPAMFQPGGESAPDHLQWPAPPEGAPTAAWDHAASVQPAATGAWQPADHGGPDGPAHSGWGQAKTATQSPDPTESVEHGAAHVRELRGQVAADA